ncbi:hypothetical protein ASPSYDRAFT_89802 [Aspergillus sydowii CBS 593.65]|uniref:Uncharacterized protein n=1 Tax=Aspergillus sydowii CBS 593.65 TaxID=1036612 RepID=A0A1L9TIG2_9EURO|nr:uncharacterized protein ASPSYDRAFT_89802 [Aspergillus sydowii CBS 593.65]OJJ59083.1 hypothetical protein ASPSYDRAFT_89802 [Aspergillus sydowii CBS 593.65]
MDPSPPPTLPSLRRSLNMIDINKTPIPAISRASPPPDTTIAEFFVSLAQKSPPRLSDSPSTTPPSSSPPTPNIRERHKPVKLLIKPIDAGLPNDPEISPLDLGPTCSRSVRSACPSPSPTLGRNPDLAFHDGLSDEETATSTSRIVTENKWHAQGQRRRKTRVTSPSTETFFSEPGISDFEELSIERKGRDMELKAKNQRKSWRVSNNFSLAKRNSKGAWHR